MKDQLEIIDVFPWNRNFETGIAIIDEQHQQLVKLLNDLARTHAHNDPDEIGGAFDRLAAYAAMHFQTEEKVWTQNLGDDPWCADHLDNHAAFLPQVVKMQEDGSDKPLGQMIDEVINFLIRWIAFHIIEDDRRLAITVRHVKNGVALEDAKNMARSEMHGAHQILTDTIMSMYETLSSRTLDLLRERVQRQEAQERLKQANTRLEEIAITDQLTGLYNRRYFETIFKREFRWARREQTPLTFIMFDIDFFKKLNDHYGHAAGDQALKEVSAATWAACRRPTDFVFRIGGEEFAVLIAGQNMQDALLQANHIRQTIADAGILHEKSTIANHVTISAGVVSHIPEVSESLDSFMKSADHRLYAAKANGRNCVIHEG